MPLSVFKEGYNEKKKQPEFIGCNCINCNMRIYAYFLSAESCYGKTKAL